MFLAGSEHKTGTQWIHGNASCSWMKCSTVMRKVAVACLCISLLQARFLSHTSSLLPGEGQRGWSPGNSTQTWDSVGVPWLTGMGKVTLASPGATCLLPQSGHLCCCIFTLSWKNQRGQSSLMKTTPDNRTSSTTWFIHPETLAFLCLKFFNLPTPNSHLL